MTDPTQVSSIEIDTTGAPTENSGYSPTAFQIDQVQESARNSLDFLAALATPETFKYLFPPVYQSIWQWLLTYIHKKRDFSQLALGLPRGFAKTSLMKLFLLYVILFTNRKFIAVMAEPLQSVWLPVLLT